MKIALIDADGLLYHSSKTTLEESIASINERIENIINKTECDYYCLFLSDKTTFRHSVYPDYKANRRKYASRLLWLKTLRAYLFEKYNAFYIHNVEADDLVSYFYHNEIGYVGSEDIGIAIELKEDFKNVSFFDGATVTEDALKSIGYKKAETIICSPDKDLLCSFEGKHFNYSYYLEDEDRPSTIIKGYWVETDKNDAYKFIWYQMLMGDTADNISGIPRVGKVTAANWLDNIHLNNCPGEVLDRYISSYRDIPKAIFEYQKNYRLLYLLRTNEDFMRECGSTPFTPEFNKVIRDSQIENLDF